MELVDFVLKIVEIEKNKYRVESQSLGGEHKAEFGFPFSDKYLTDFLSQMRNPQLYPLIYQNNNTVKEFGTKLYNAVFTGQIRDALVTTQFETKKTDKGFRIKVRLSEAPSLSDLPWEFLHDGDKYFSLSESSPLIRYLDLPFPISNLAIEPPINILVVITNPSSTEKLDIQSEFSKLNKALNPLISSGLLHIKLLNQATLSELQKELRRSNYHILHYIGHGSISEISGETLLHFEDDQGCIQLVNGERLVTLLRDHRSLRMVVLNSCNGACQTGWDQYSSLAAIIVKSGIPAVIAMQFPITDVAAITFAENFYAAISDGCSVESALTEARKAIRLSGNEIEWGVPVLFLRGDNSQLFSRYPLSGRQILKKAKQAERTVTADTEPVLKLKPSHRINNNSLYQSVASSYSPALRVYLVDVGNSSVGKIRNDPKLQLVAESLRSVFKQMLFRSTKGNIVIPKYRISLFAYSDYVVDLFDGTKNIDEVARLGLPRLVSTSGCNTVTAFTQVEKFLKEEIPFIQDAPAPLLCHIGRTKQIDPNLLPIVNRIMNLSVKDGNVLVENILLADDGFQMEMENIKQWRGFQDKNTITEDYLQLLFNMSSQIPDSYRSFVIEKGYDLASTAKMLFVGASPEIINLGLLLTAATPMTIS